VGEDEDGGDDSSDGGRRWAKARKRTTARVDEDGDGAMAGETARAGVTARQSQVRRGKERSKQGALTN
jgi:hypothetical protein